VGEQGGVWLIPALLFYTSKSIPFQTDSSIILLFNQIEIAHILINPNKIYGGPGQKYKDYRATVEIRSL
jgi:hypothetical protein